MRFARKAGNKEEVQRQFLAAKAIWPTEPEKIAALWGCQYKAPTYLGKFKEAKSYLNQVANLIPENNKVYHFK